MPTSTKVKNLNINELTEAQYDAAVQGGVIGANELSVLTDVSYVEPSDLATVATTGDYSDLINRPTNLVSTNTAQTISGMKTFSGDITLSGTTSIKNNTGGTNYTMLYRDASTIHVGGSTSVLKLEGSGTRPAYNNDSLALLSDVTAELPSQTGHSGEFLTTDGTSVSWAAVSGGSLPSQTGHSGEFLTTDGTDASWSDKPLVNNATPTNSLSILGTNTTSDNTITIGKNCNVYGVQGNSVVIGNSISVNYVPESVGIGNNCVPYNYSVCVGKNSGGAGSYAVSLGWQTRVNATHAIQIGNTGSTTTNSDANTMKVANANGNFEMMSADGTIPSDRLVHAINKYSTMPTAASTNEGWIVQFTGTTDSTYTHGHLYECVSDGQTPATYSWTEVSMGGGGLQNNATNSTSIAVSETQNTTARTVVFGSAASATTNWCTVYGATATATGAQSMSIGNGKVAGGYSICIANSSAAEVTGQRSVVVCPRVNSGGNFNANDTIVLGSVSSLLGLSSNTFYVGLDWTNASKTFELLSADGTIPAARHAALPAADGTYTLQLVIADGVPTLSWVAV